ncbi:MFS transporter [Trueperella pyogenes]|uniref:MFS transporter n=3 Tax=Trueperella pyogenes TaxID=1661 RepID=UPI00345D6C9F
MATSTSILWNNPDYRAWFAGDTSAKFVGSLRAFALPLAVVALTGSATQAGLIATTSQAIGILCMIPGGVVVDRIDRRKLLYTFAALGTIIWTTIAILFALEALTFPVLITLTSLGAVNGGLFGQTTDVVLRSLVHGENLVKASAANHGRDATIEVTAPPAGAALFALGSWVPFAASVVGYLLLGLCARLIHHDLRPRADDASETGGVRMLWVNFVNDVVDAYRYVRAHPTILQLLTPAAISNIGFMGIQYAITFALVLDGQSPGAIAAYNMATAGCAFAGSLLAGRYSARFRTGWVYSVAIPATALAMVPTIFSLRYAVIVPCMGLYLGLSIMTAGHHSIIFSTAPTAMQGRLWAVFGLITSLPLAAAPTIAGLILDHGNYHVAMALFFILLFMPSLAWAAMPRVRTLPRPADWGNIDL